MSIWNGYNTARKDWTSIGETSALMAASFSSKSMAATELVLQSMLDWVSQENVQTPAQFEETFGQRRYFDKLRERIANLDQVDVATFIAKDGRIVSFSRSFPPPPINLADRDYFISQSAAKPVPTSLGNVVKNRGNGRWTFYQAKRVLNREGLLVGVVIVGIEAAYFAEFFRQIVPNSANSITFWRSDGTVLSTDSMAESRLGRTYPDSQSLMLIRSNPQGATAFVSGPRVINETGGSQGRLLVVRPVQNSDAYVTVSIGEDAILAAWRDDRNISLLVAAALSGMVLLAAGQTLRSRKEALRRERLELQEHLLRAVIEMPLTVSAVLDGRGDVLLSSSGFDELFRRASTSKIFSVAAIEGAAPILQFINGASNTSTVEMDMVDLAGRQRVLVLSMAKQELLEIGQCTILVGADETERRAAQIAINQSAKMIVLGEMATGMAHELNQPINIIHMAAQNALVELEPAEPGAPMPSPTTEMAEFVMSRLETILSQTKRAAELISHMRIFGRVPRDKAVPFDARQACSGALMLIGEQTRLRGIAVHMDVGDLPAMVLGHKTMLEQVLINLINNARDAFGAVEADEKQIAVSCHTGDRKVVIEVSDNGPGIPETIRSRIFEPFFTTKDVGSGTGLGLAISYGIVTDMSGSIAVAPSDRGTKIRIELPVAEAALDDRRRRQGSDA